ncbi:DUF4352 domain-containing protein [Planotetraspora kaengkrachanensis]|uniref:Mpr protein n=1 Tax=Planotetraspora kaengkrachanensis TaxID=575193 RepID=A0A8J3VC49_9ACTN|nr:DUF4352 domain-containing protein [Planotetraspora kaengkrachanensis]GIG84537.1 Mpr protein [Planotetraspora kaengkrachanensis]
MTQSDGGPAYPIHQTSQNPRHQQPYSRPYGPAGTFQAPPKKGGRGLTWILAVSAILAVFAACGALASNGSGAPAPAGGTASREAQRAETATAGIGTQVRDGDFAFKVTKLGTASRVGDRYLGKDAQGQFVLVHVTVKNIGERSQAFTGEAQKLFDATGKEFSADSEAAIYLGQASKSLYEEINPGNSVKGIVVFDVPRGTDAASIELHDSPLSGGAAVVLN